MKGISPTKSKTWVGVGVGALTEVNKNTSLYVNYDFKLTKNKGHNNVVTAGVRVTF
ncbi:autotransporter outer membrane beta-barrel domain-containing protein [Actinobacillus capsulatus]|uniref:autotransporter outer membrane beta-barrel domain-containing protein n=1 Tax=Actinobacillus capsulatus TaxID=717 RepID=UPI00039D7BC1|nr:autotransporter outer membrane beta-barrel domain-containing protein [Actinobacillus capsulatus]